MSGHFEELAAQRRYGAWLAWGTRIGLTLLVIAFLAYCFGFVAPHVPIERLPSLWGQPASALLAQTGVRPGWGWSLHIQRGDMMVLAAIAWLASCSIACLAAVIPVFRRRGETIFALVCLLQIAVLVLAASGILSSAH